MSIVDSARYELKLAGFDQEEIDGLAEILDKFFDMYDSGGAVYFMAPILQKLIAGKPLSPIGTTEEEWFDHEDMFNHFPGVVQGWQNKRCGSVFRYRMEDGTFTYTDIDNPQGRHVQITMPYDPENIEVSSPLVTI